MIQIICFLCRGLGISTEDTGNYIKSLEKGNYILILREGDQDLNLLEDALVRSEGSLNTDSY